MVCIYCQHEDTRVINSRISKKTPSVWRRRQCPQCRTIFTTYERVAEKELPLVSTTGATDRFSLPRLMVSIYRDLPDTPARADIAMELATTIMQKLTMTDTSLTSQRITEVTYDTLGAYHPSSGMRYGLIHGVINPPVQHRAIHKI